MVTESHAGMMFVIEGVWSAIYSPFWLPWLYLMQSGRGGEAGAHGQYADLPFDVTGRAP